MRFRLTKTSNRSGADYHNDTGVAPPFLPGATVVDRGENAWPQAVQYVEVSTLEELMALVEEHGRFVLHRTEREDPGIERLPVLELYDCRRE